jgi:hypothetical protein
MKMLQDALQASWKKGKTPLLIDTTEDQGGFSALETFYSYSGHQLLEMKKSESHGARDEKLLVPTDSCPP